MLDPDPPWFKQTTRLDASVLGSALLAFDGGSEIDHPCLDADEVRRPGGALRLKQVPVNLAWRRGGNAGAGIGRFPEDANDGFGSTGGNPWPVTTLWMAQYHGHRGNWEQAEGYLRFVTTHVEADAISEQIDAADRRKPPRRADWSGRTPNWSWPLLARARRERSRGWPDPPDG